MSVTAPKLHPKFSALIAGCDIHEPIDDASQQALSDVMTSILETLRKYVERTNIIYDCTKHKTELSILVGNKNTEILSLAHNLASQHHFSIDVVQCGKHEAKQSKNIQTSRLVILGHDTDNADLLYQENLIQEATLRAFSDILIWFGDCIDTPYENRSLRLLRDTILEGKPIIWIHNQGKVEIIDYGLLDEPHRLLLLTSDESQTPIKSLFVNYSIEILANELMFTSNPIEISHLKNKPTTQKLLNYFKEQSPSTFSLKTTGKIDQILSAFIQLSGFRKAFSLRIQVPWYGVEGDLGLIEQGLEIEEPKGLQDRFVWSDKIANVAAGKQRDTIWFLYFLSTLAVFSAVAGAIHLGHFADWLWPSIEMVSIVSILFFYWKSTRLDIHGKWLFHRFLAEQLRYTRLGYPLLTFQEPLLAPLRYSDSDKHGNVQSNLINAETWILKRTVVSAGLPRLFTQNTYKPHELNKYLTHYVVGIIKNQIDYHHKKHHSEHKMEHRLHGFSSVAFILTGLAVIAHFFIHAEWLLILTGALPALAASIHGITTMNEMGRVSQLSNHTEKQLKQLLISIKRLKDQHTEDENYFIQLRNLTHESAFVMSNVNRQWQDLIEHQQTTLPA